MNDSTFPKQPSALYRNADLPAGQALPGQSSHSTAKKRVAAVLLPLIWSEDQWQLLFIRRTENRNDRHSGQVAFPGGAKDPQDNSSIATALRETEEEIGVQSGDIKVLGELEIYTTSSLYQVTPVVAHMNWPVPVTPAPDEVARVFSIPLDWLQNQDNFEIRSRELQSVEPGDDRVYRHPVIYFDRYDGELLWGASARMTLNFIRALDQGQLALPTNR
ncbi:MAG: CoA pyrophosphatase [Gammaproteobacteria bacterium]|nr:CoA pyrophosphatase [Gammaproteobacteria bacterium]